MNTDFPTLKELNPVVEKKSCISNRLDGFVYLFIFVLLTTEHYTVQKKPPPPFTNSMTFNNHAPV